ncbi:MAG: hypothetical protein LBP59_07905 [Planctomycetaceae bacterium]|jgi:hypothetical protein|nr:hypothetical protein [Planctomycetaceae bacterium]
MKNNMSVQDFINDKKLHHDLCLLFTLDIFKETQLFAQLKEWEKHSCLLLF